MESNNRGGGWTPRVCFNHMLEEEEEEGRAVRESEDDYRVISLQSNAMVLKDSRAKGLIV